MFRFGFVVENLLGHTTHYQNLQYWVTQDSEISPVWMPIKPTNDFWSSLPGIRNWSLQASYRARRAIRATLQQQPLDALFLHTQSTALFSIDLMRQIPTVISVDATPLNYDTVGAGYNHKVSQNSWIDRQKFRWNQQTYEAARAIVAFSDWVKHSLITDYGITADKIHVIRPGIDLTQWKPVFHKTSRYPMRLLFVGGDFARKGGEILLQAFRTKLHETCVLDIVTKDEYVAQVTAEDERIQVHTGQFNNSPRLKELFANVDIFVFPTQADCYGLVIMEAMASGLPIIATDVGAVREQVQPEINGLLIPTNDVDALIATVQELVTNESKRQAMAIASRRLAEEKMDGQQNYGRILTLMKDLASGAELKQSRSTPALAQR